MKRNEPIRPLIRFQFDEEKATAGAAVLLRKYQRRMRYFCLIKLLYIAERESLRLRSRPIIGDDYVSMAHGPVLSKLYALIKADPADFSKGNVWHRHFQKIGYTVALRKNPGEDALSESEVEILRHVYAKHRHRIPGWGLRDYTHTFPEWRDPGKSSFEILPEEILRLGLRMPEAAIEEIAQETAAQNAVDALIREHATP